MRPDGTDRSPPVQVGPVPGTMVAGCLRLAPAGARRAWLNRNAAIRPPVAVVLLGQRIPALAKFSAHPSNAAPRNHPASRTPIRRSQDRERFGWGFAVHTIGANVDSLTIIPEVDDPSSILSLPFSQTVGDNYAGAAALNWPYNPGTALVANDNAGGF